jgi:hypothetical protein
MSKQYPGGLITKSPITPSGPFETSTAPGVWTLDQQAYWQKQGNWPTQGNVLSYIEDLFSTYLYTGNGSTQTITNGINLSSNGGLVWIKQRAGTGNHTLFDTARGAYFRLRTDTTEAQVSTSPNGVTSFTSSGFSLAGASSDYNGSAETLVSWTFREQAKFFDIVTYTGDGASNRSIAHSINGNVGAIFIKRTNGSSNWAVACSNSSGNAQFLMLNRTEAASATVSSGWFSNTTFKVGTSDWPASLGAYGFDTNGTGDTYVAYIFASNAGGFPASGSGSNNGITCGSFTTDADGLNSGVTLGYEPQWMLVKPSSTTDNWQIVDNMRGMSLADTYRLFANTSGATNQVGAALFAPTATGFTCPLIGGLAGSATYIYIAIRRGPMKVPTVGTTVFAPVSATPVAGPTTTFTTNFPVDFFFAQNRQNGGNTSTFDRLRGPNLALITQSIAGDNDYGSSGALLDYMTQSVVRNFNTGFGPIIGWNFRRAPGFFDEVCYTGTGSYTTYNHNLGVAPELIITKSRSANGAWYLNYGFDSTSFQSLRVNATAAADFWNYTDNVNITAQPTSTTFKVGTNANGSSVNYVAYLFATCAGVSKVGSYTGTGATQTINCGFTAGSRFVMIKRTDSTGDWYIWDSARGIIPSNDPYLLLNSTAAEVTGTDYVDTSTTGFDISSTAPAAINANGGTFIFLAIA